MRRILLFFFTISLMQLPAQTITVNGKYHDKKGNALDNAKVKYFYHDGMVADSTITATDGYFELQVLTYVNVEETPGMVKQKPLPNPFSGSMECIVEIPCKAQVTIINSKGNYVDGMRIEEAGLYRICWGGANCIGQETADGIYFLNIFGCTFKTTEKIVKQGEGSGQRLKASFVSESEMELKNAAAMQDKITFSRLQSSYMEMLINNPTQDTSLGIITGNAGPDAIGAIVTTVHVDSTNTWNLNNYFYNDDQSSYETTDPNFEIQDDSIMVFTGTETGLYVFDIIATDTADESLKDTTGANITVTSELVFTISGTYNDKIDDPIASADVLYYENGNALSGQTITASDGSFELTITSQETTPDSLVFQKTNTSELYLLFNTPQGDTTLGAITGNIGPEALSNVNASYFTIDSLAQWNLNDHFHNDDQSTYTNTGSDFTIVQDTMLQLMLQDTGTYNTTVTATDPQDAGLTAEITADVDVQYTFSIPDTSLPEDSERDTLFHNLNIYKNPDFTDELTYQITNQSNPQLINLICQDTVILIDSIQKDSSGESTITLQISDGTHTEDYIFDVTINSLPDLTGAIRDIFDSTLVAGAVVQVEVDGDYYYDTTDANGNYQIQLPYNVDSVTYYPVTITHDDYTPYHTWATVEPDTKVQSPDINIIDNTYAGKSKKATKKKFMSGRSTTITADFDIIPDTFVWDLYNEAFRDSTEILGGGFPYEKRYTSRHWFSSPPIHAYSDNSLTGGADITVNFNNLVYNLQNILPGFNPRDALPSNIYQHTTFSSHTPEDGDFVTYFEDLPGGIAGEYVIDYVDAGIENATAIFDHTVGGSSGTNSGADNKVFNQELGSYFGAVQDDPPVSSDYTSVFTEPPGSNTYTSDDYDCADVYLNRSRVHYQNLSLTGEDSYDWEMRPDEVQTWYPNTSDSGGQRTFVVYTIYKDGTRTSTSYDRNKVPEEVKLRFPMMFDGYLEKRLELEKQKTNNKAGTPVKISAKQETDNVALQNWLKKKFPNRYK